MTKITYVQEVVLEHQSDACLIWPYGLDGRGYPFLKVNRRRVIGTRHICTLTHGAPPSPTHQAAHSCGNPSCVNPRHLRWATPKENVADKLLHGTDNTGSRNGRAKLNEDMVRAIRCDRRRRTEIAASYGVSDTTIRQIKDGTSWRHVSQ